MNLTRLREIAVERNEEELAIEADHQENGDLYRASVEIALKIRHAMNLAEISENELAAKLNISKAALEELLSGRADMQLKMMVKVEKALGIHIIDRTIDPDFP